MIQESQVFISYASENVDQARRLYHDLKKRGVRVWFDKEDLKVGKWKPQITKAIAQSKYFLFCLSEAALKKIGNEPGFQDVELNTAFEIALAQSDQTFTIVPVRLEDVDRGDSRISVYQQHDLFTDWEGTLDNLALLFGRERTEDEKIAAALHGKAEAFYLSGNNEKALIILPTIEELEGETLRSLVTKGAALHTLGNFQEALFAFDKAISLLPGDKTKLRPVDHIVFTNRGNALRDLGRYEEAFTAYSESLLLNPNDHSAWENKARLFVRFGDWQNALQAIDTAISIKPDSAIAHIMRAITLGVLNRYPESLSASERALDLQPEHQPDRIQAFLANANALIAMNKHEEALESLESVLSLDPNNVDALTDKGRSLFSQYRFEEALESLDIALQHDPHNKRALQIKQAATILSLASKLSE